MRILLLMLVPALLFFSGCATCPWCGQPLRHETEFGLQPPPKEIERMLHGSVTYLQRIAMHPAAHLNLRLWDITGPGLPELVSEKIVQRPGEVPVEFEMRMEPGRIDPRRDYVLSATILVEDTVLFATDTDYRVLTQGFPDTVQLVLARPASGTREP